MKNRTGKTGRNFRRSGPGQTFPRFARRAGAGPSLKNIPGPDSRRGCAVERFTSPRNCWSRIPAGCRCLTSNSSNFHARGWLSTRDRKRVETETGGARLRRALAEVRRFKQRECCASRADLARLSNVVEITREISDLADACLDAVWRICRQQFTERFGQPFHQDGRELATHGILCARHGQARRQELNYSSMWTCCSSTARRGRFSRNRRRRKKRSAPRCPTANFQQARRSFHRRSFPRDAGRMLFRIDLRLRPESDAGPLCVRWKAMRIITRNGTNLGADDAHQGAGVAVTKVWLPSSWK